jgi:hypothetical protein
MNTQLLINLHSDLRKLAGSEWGAATRRVLFQRRALRLVLNPDPTETPTEQGGQMLEFLEELLDEWNIEIKLRKNDHPTADQCKMGLKVLLNVVEEHELVKYPSDRRLLTIDLLNLDHCGLVHWRQNIEPMFLEPLAQALLEEFGHRLKDLDPAS